MKPLQLSLSGFTAFREYTEISFEGLDLFALVGPTGSGKSSILDAMTFALYGQTARLGATGMDALISQGQRALQVGLTFQLYAEDGPQTYRVSRTKGHRTADSNAKIEQQVAGGWKDLAEGAGQRVVNAQVQKLIGLDFKTFTKSVFLPQGEFARLLHGTGKERQELLGELMGLDTIKAMHKYAGEQAKDYGFRLDSNAKVLGQEYADVSPERVRELREAREKLAEQLDAWEDEREAAQARQTALGKVAELWQAHEDAQRKLKVQRGRAGEIEQGIARAAQARRVAAIGPLLDREGRTRIAAEREESALSSAQAEAQKAAHALAKAEAELQAAQANEARIPELEERAAALRDAEALAARLGRAGGTVDSRHPQPLEWDEDAFAEAKAGADKLQKLKLERTQLASRRAAAEANAERLAKDRELLANRTAQQQRVLEEGKEAAARLEAVSAALAKVQAAAGLAGYAQALKVGEPCPLCGQVVDAAHIPQHPDSAELERLELAVKAADEERGDLRGQYKELTAEIGVLEKDLQRREAEVSDTREQLAQDEADNKAALERIAGDPAEEAARLLAGLAEQVRSFGADPAGERKRAQASVADIRRKLTAAAGTQAQAASAQAAAEATLQSAQRAAQERRAEATEAAEEVQAALQAAGLSADEVKAAALPEAEIAALEQAGQNWRAGLESLEARVSELGGELEAALGGHDYDPEALPKLRHELAGLEAQLSEGRSEAGRLSEQETSAAARLERKQGIEAEMKELSEQVDVWKTLANSLRANEFQQFLLQEVEANLLTGAGHILHQISDQRYRLVLDGSDYAVEDLWNAGEKRAVKTLSGGETFLASLSLAIALSDYLAGNKILGALFLDEGFGTLDPQALEAVAGALESLRTQGRMVGVVTHVESLSERLPAQLLVTKSVAGSSVMRLES